MNDDVLFDVYTIPLVIHSSYASNMLFRRVISSTFPTDILDDHIAICMTSSKFWHEHILLLHEMQHISSLKWIVYLEFE